VSSLGIAAMRSVKIRRTPLTGGVLAGGRNDRCLLLIVPSIWWPGCLQKLPSHLRANIVSISSMSGLEKPAGNHNAETYPANGARSAHTSTILNLARAPDSERVNKPGKLGVFGTGCRP
jgi:hypothetical protein